MCHQTQNYCLVITSHKEWWLWQLTKACVCYFLFFSHYGSPFENCGKCLHLKKIFHSQDIQIFVFPSSHPFLPVGHWIRGWSKINRKVYDIINCVNKNLITHFVWYLEEEKIYHIKLYPWISHRVLNKEHFYREILQKMC